MNDTEPNEEELKQYALELQRAFRVEKERKTGKRPARDGRTESNSVWKKVAAAAMKLKATPDDYIHAQFKFFKGTVFPNALYGPTAQRNYLRLRDSVANVTPEQKPVDPELATPGKMELAGILRHTIDLLHDHTGTENIISLKAVQYVTEHPWLFDAIGVMLLTGGVVRDYNRLFLAEAKLQLQDNLHILREARNLGFNPDSIIEQEEEE